MSFNVSLLIIFISLLFSAFFSGMEIAFISSNKLKIELDKKLGALPAKIYSYFINNQSKFISTLLLGNNIALVIYGIFTGAMLKELMAIYISNEFTLFILQTVISTLLILVAAEFLPKTLFRINPNRTLSVFAIPVAIIYSILYPITWVTIGIANFIIKSLFKVSINDDKIDFGKVDLDNFLKEATSDPNSEESLENEVQILQNALDFSNVKARECMVPRTEIIAMEESVEIETLRKKFVETGLSKILIYRESIDNIIGYTHSFELFKKPNRVKDILLPVSVIPESMPANEILEHLIQQKKSIVVVVDEFGGTSGMLTLEDIVEELFGDIEDEHDLGTLIENQLSEREFIFSARLEVDFINEKYILKIPDSDDYETLAGFILSFSESIPKKGDIITIHPFKMKILKVSGNKIELVQLLKIAE